jgi:hypothetical protein
VDVGVDGLREPLVPLIGEQEPVAVREGRGREGRLGGQDGVARDHDQVRGVHGSIVLVEKVRRRWGGGGEGGEGRGGGSGDEKGQTAKRRKEEKGGALAQVQLRPEPAQPVALLQGTKQRSLGQRHARTKGGRLGKFSPLNGKGRGSRGRQREAAASKMVGTAGRRGRGNVARLGRFEL